MCASRAFELLAACRAQEAIIYWRTENCIHIYIYRLRGRLNAATVNIYMLCYMYGRAIPIERNCLLHLDRSCVIYAKHSPHFASYARARARTEAKQRKCNAQTNIENHESLSRWRVRVDWGW